MTEMQEQGEITSITKSDRRGRARYRREYKEEVLDAFELSSLSGPDFAEHCGLKYPTFAGWVAKRKRERSGESGRTGSAQKFVIADFADALGAPSSGGCLRVSLPGGASAEVVDARGAELLGALLKSLS